MKDGPPRYADFRVLLDEPSSEPRLGFSAYAGALTELITQSKPQFSIGIFGSWGSGKTSLMKAICKGLQPGDAPNPNAVTVWFNPWRYEKEPHLIVPLLDTLREALVEWATQQPADAKQRAMKAASTVGRAARAIIAGLTLTAKLPLVEASLEPGKVIGSWRQGGVDDLGYAREPQSFYHASFLAMQGALSEFFRHDVSRVVVFIDDLDRCLPEKALEVLESMKLFFDLDGFVFVVGLDQAVIERAVSVKYPSSGGPQEISATDYVKKIFQVPFGIPPIRPRQLVDYIDSIIESAGLSAEQSADLIHVVQPHLIFLAEEQTLNPRELKRFINAYTLQVKMLEPRLLLNLDPHAVLAVQALIFRRDWIEIYKQLISDPTQFSADLDVAVQDGFWPGRKRFAVPPSFATYVQGVGAALRTANLDEYIASVEATHFTDPTLLELSKAVRELWRAWGGLTGPHATEAAAAAISSALSTVSAHTPSGFASNLMRTIQELQTQLSVLQQRANVMTDAELAAWRDRFAPQLEALEADVDERRRLTSVGGTSVA